jgi:outer membrane protein assembly factor BamD
MKQIVRCALIVGVIALMGCGSSNEATTPTAEERFAHAKVLFDDEDYVEAMNEFTVVTLQFPGSAVASEAQFYIGECRFARQEYLLAAFEYNQLRRNYPASPRLADAQFKLGASYEHLSPKSTLDQQYTRKAIDEYQTFVEYYPANSRAPEADAKIRELTTKLAKKQIEIARLYRTMGYSKASQFYYDDVIERYHDTEFGPLAYIEKTQLLIDKKKFAEADQQISRFLTLYPNNVLRGQAEELKQEIARNLRAGGTSSVLQQPGGATLAAQDQDVRQ